MLGRSQQHSRNDTQTAPCNSSSNAEAPSERQLLQMLALNSQNNPASPPLLLVLPLVLLPCFPFLLRILQPPPLPMELFLRYSPPLPLLPLPLAIFAGCEPLLPRGVLLFSRRARQHARVHCTALVPAGPGGAESAVLSAGDEAWRVCTSVED